MPPPYPLSLLAVSCSGPVQSEFIFAFHIKDELCWAFTCPALERTVSLDTGQLACSLVGLPCTRGDFGAAVTITLKSAVSCE